MDDDDDDLITVDALTKFAEQQKQVREAQKKHKDAAEQKEETE